MIDSHPATRPYTQPLRASRQEIHLAVTSHSARNRTVSLTRHGHPRTPLPHAVVSVRWLPNGCPSPGAALAPVSHRPMRNVGT